MEGEEGEGLRLSKRIAGGEVDYKTKSGTAWSHSYLNQKPWHPLSYPNQRRKWIAEQTHANHDRRAQEVAREYAQEQEFFRQTALVSKKEKEKLEIMKAVSFMYVRPPGYNAESAKAAEIADETNQDQTHDPSTTSMPTEPIPGKDQASEQKKKPRPKDVFGRSLPTEEEFEVLKNAPKMETGVAGRAKPFGIELRNVRCLRCGNYGHQSGDRECPLKDAIMPNEESRLKRDDPLTAILAHTDPTQPLKWELKQKPGISPPRGGFKTDDPNQQIVAEDIFDEYGGFLSGGDLPELLTNFSSKPKKKSGKKSKHKKQHSSPSSDELEEDDLSSFSKHREEKLKKRKHKKKKKKLNHSESSCSDSSGFDMHDEKRNRKYEYSSEDSEDDRRHRANKSSNLDRHGTRKHKRSYLSEDSYSDGQRSFPLKNSKVDGQRSFPSKNSKVDGQLSLTLKNSKVDGHHKRKRKHSYSSEDLDVDEQNRIKKGKEKRFYSREELASEREHRRGKSREKHSRSCLRVDSDSDRWENSRHWHRHRH
ncbi:hypothetical protein UlMin_042304 [Ulmus minor]